MSWVLGGDDSGFCLSLASMRVWKKERGTYARETRYVWRPGTTSFPSIYTPVLPLVSREGVSAR